MAALTDAAGDVNGKKGSKRSKGGTTVQGDKEKSDIFKLVSASIGIVSSAAAMSPAAIFTLKGSVRPRFLPLGQSIMVPLHLVKASEHALGQP